MRPTSLSWTDFPKVVLHDHLDGGLRPNTLGDLLTQSNAPIPWGDEDPAAWFSARASASQSLPEYLKVFAYTLQCMQTEENLERVAYEAVEDLALDHVRYAELRFAPLLCTQKGLAPTAVMNAVQAGMHRAMAKYPDMKARLLVCAMREKDPADSVRTTQLALWAAKQPRSLVVGLDLAVPESGYLPTRHKAAFDMAHAEGLPVTVHAGESAGLDSLQSALHDARASRIGHGIRIMDGVTPAHNGDLLWEVVEKNVVLEVCPTSNIQTASSPSWGDHPLAAMLRMGLPVSIHTDNRLLSGTTTSQEWQRAQEHFGLSTADMLTCQQHAISGIFANEDMKKWLRAETASWVHAQAPVSAPTPQY